MKITSTETFSEVLIMFAHFLQFFFSNLNLSCCTYLIKSKCSFTLIDEQVSVYADSLVPTVRRALTDDLSEVREAAAETFDNLHSNIGQRALDEILPELLKQLVCGL